MDPINNQRIMVNSCDSPDPCKPSRPRIVIALGDPAGIGAEVTLRALADPRTLAAGIDPADVVLVGCRRWLEQSYRQLRQHGGDPLVDPADLTVVDCPLAGPILPGVSGSAAGAASFAWLGEAVAMVQGQPGQVLVTAPIAKASWHAAGHRYPGQTERLAELAGIARASMLFTAVAPGGHWRLNTLLATTHIPLAEVPRQLTPELIEQQLDRLLGFCQRFQSRPRLVVAGLNPHAGEAGTLGREEQDWLVPCLKEWRARHPEVRLEGPLPPDTCWLEAGEAWRGAGTGADGYLALYHDQGLIPVKLLAFDAAVNTSLGLPFLRTSPDHGTAFAIAGQGVARPDSMIAALITAWQLG